jgi:glucose-1-phosphate cytidylyltransferase
MPKPMPPAMILCGGQGTRLREVTEMLPKPMVPIGPHPILWHIMKSFAAHGVRRFILCLGYKREAFIDYFLNYRARAADITVRTGAAGGVTYHGDPQEDWEVTLADTGEQTMTGGRVRRGAHYAGDEFFLTYGDGLANVDLKALLAFHRAAARPITVTAVHPAGRFGELSISQGRVDGFNEKPQTSEGLINGGFMVIDRRFVERYLPPDDSLILEQEPMRRAAADEAMSAFVHHGFWQCMDTPREHQFLTSLWERGNAPWKEAW